nr:hypothetical protein [uncultured Methanoregula sp.]
MTRAAKIERTQKLFLKAMKEKFAADPDPNSWSKGPAPGFTPELVFETCPFCGGQGRRKGAFCHQCGGTGSRRVRT